jgi:hypothetical protein
MPSPKRPRGAPPGNLNALKHGFYSRGFRTMDIADLDAMLENGLKSEINMLRVSTRRLLELSQENTDVDQGIHLLSVLGVTATRLANLIRAILKPSSVIIRDIRDFYLHFIRPDWRRLADESPCPLPPPPTSTNRNLGEQKPAPHPHLPNRDD